MLRRLKLVAWAIIVVFTIHALPGNLTVDAWPIIRWGMYYKPQPAVDRIETQYRLNLVDMDCQEQLINPNTIYASTAAYGYQGRWADSLITATINQDEPERQIASQQAIQMLISNHYDLKIAAVEIWQYDFAFTVNDFPHIDYDAPVNTVRLGYFSPQETTNCPQLAAYDD